MENMSLLLVFAAGLVSILSPCVLPVIPIVITGGSDDHKWRPVLVVSGLTLTFVLMGAASSLFGSLIGSKMIYIEKAAGLLIIALGLMMVLNVNIFKHFGFFTRFAQKSRGRLGGFFLGTTLGIVWIPCVGPVLSGILAMVAAKGELSTGIFMLFVYSIGFALPLLLAGYASQFFRKKFSKIGKYPVLINSISGVLIMILGAIIFTKGVMWFSL